MGRDRAFSDEFKRAAVQRLVNGEVPIVVSRELKLASGTIYQWRKKFAAELAHGTVGPTSAAKGAVVAIRKGPKGRSVSFADVCALYFRAQYRDAFGTNTWALCLSIRAAIFDYMADEFA